MDTLESLLTLDAITKYRRTRTERIHTLMQPATPAISTSDARQAIDYALANHCLERAETAARAGDLTLLESSRAGMTRDWSSLTTQTALGPRLVLAPSWEQMTNSPSSDVPYYVVDAETQRAADDLCELAANAYSKTAEAGLARLTAPQAPVLVLTGHRRPDETLRNFSITRLPGTIFTEHVGDAVVLGREIVHESAHNWLNDAFAALKINLSDDVTFFSPWRQTKRPVFGFIHACFAFPLTVIYAARVLSETTGIAQKILADHLHQQQRHLSTVQEDITSALEMIHDGDLRNRIHVIYRMALNASV